MSHLRLLSLPVPLILALAAGPLLLAEDVASPVDAGTAPAMTGSATVAAPVAAVAGSTTAAVLDLEKAIRLAGVTTQVAISKLQTSSSQADYRATRWGLLPGLTGVASGNRGTSAYRGIDNLGNDTEAVGPYNTVDARLRASQVIFDRATWNATEAAQQAVLESQANERLTLEASSSEAANAYVALVQGNALVATRTEDLALAKELLGLAKARFEAGAAEAIDVTRAEAQVASSQVSLVSARTQEQQAVIAFARILDFDPGEPLAAAASLSDKLVSTDAPEDVIKALGQARYKRPEFRASDAAIAQQAARLAAADGALWGTASVFADGGYTGPKFNDTAGTWGVGVQYSIPLLSGQRDAAESAQFQLRIAEHRRRDLERQVAAEVRTALMVVVNAREALVGAREQVRLADQELRQARERFRAGAAGNLDVINAQVNAATAAVVRITAEATLAKATVGLAKAVGVASEVK